MQTAVTVGKKHFWTKIQWANASSLKRQPSIKASYIVFLHSLFQGLAWAK